MLKIFMNTFFFTSNNPGIQSDCVSGLLEVTSMTWAIDCIPGMPGMYTHHSAAPPHSKGRASLCYGEQRQSIALKNLKFDLNPYLALSKDPADIYWMTVIACGYSNSGRICDCLKSAIFGRKTVSYSSSHEHLVPQSFEYFKCFDIDEIF